jgi:iron(III) transport system ATP-binding protein
MIAGFNSIEAGDFFFDNTRINDMDPAKRNIGMVFQNYAIFPHMTVRKNVEYGLHNRKLPNEIIAKKTDEFLKLMQIDSYADRSPDHLSGGQQQRVALARALVVSPSVLLMDEPLSNLDAKLRLEMRSVIKEIQHSIGITTVYVTHDQEEAMAISNRIAVMDHGVIQQIGKPKDLYQRPTNIFVATFIGRTNIIKSNGVYKDGLLALQIGSYQTSQALPNKTLPGDVQTQLSIRPEDFIINPDAGRGIKARVLDSIFLGLNTHYFAELETGERVEIIQESTIDSIIEPGTPVVLGIKMEKINIFSADGSVNLTAL